MDNIIYDILDTAVSRTKKVSSTDVDKSLIESLRADSLKRIDSLRHNIDKRKHATNTQDFDFDIKENLYPKPIAIQVLRCCRKFNDIFLYAACDINSALADSNNNRLKKFINRTIKHADNLYLNFDKRITDLQH